MLEIFLIILFLISIVGIGIIVRRKIPVLVELSPQTVQSGFVRKERYFSKSLILQKILSKFRILVLKTDNKTNEWLRDLRKKSLDNKTKFSDNYWDKLRK